MSYGFFQSLPVAVRLHPDPFAFLLRLLCLPLPFFRFRFLLLPFAPVLTFYPAGSRSDRCTLRICAMRPVCAARTLFATPERPPFPPCRCQGNNGCFHNRPTVGLLWKGRKSSSVRCSPVRQVRDGRDTFPAAG